MKKARYRTIENNEIKEIEIEYDETKPCIACGEPVISASMGGTVICPWCDCGKCRHCGVAIFAIKEEIDGGHSKKQVLDHMKWHRERQPDFNKNLMGSFERMEKT